MHLANKYLIGGGVAVFILAATLAASALGSLRRTQATDAPSTPTLEQVKHLVLRLSQ